MNIEYIKKQQKQLERKKQRAAELEAKKEAARVAKMKAEAREREEKAYRKRLLLEQQENERLRRQRIQREKEVAEQKWDNQRDILLAQSTHRRGEDDRLEEIRFIIQNREPSRETLDWATDVYNNEFKANHIGAHGLVGYWKFNEGKGTTVQDLSGKGNHGTFAAISGDTTDLPTWEKRNGLRRR